MEQNRQTTVLAIDADSEQLATIATALESAGYRCHCAHDAESAQQEASSDTPDLIISDVNLVGRDGPALCDALKQRTGLVNVPVMFLSAKQVPDVIRRANAAGSYYYLRKPIDTRLLVQLVEKACGPCTQGFVTATVAVPTVAPPTVTLPARTTVVVQPRPNVPLRSGQSTDPRTPIDARNGVVRSEVVSSR